MSLYNNSLLLFDFAWLVEKFALLIIVATGLLELISAVLFYVHDEEDEREVWVYILTFLLIFDGLVIHYPFTEMWNNMGKEMTHLSTNIGLVGGLWMLHGFRDET